MRPRRPFILTLALCVMLVCTALPPAQAQRPADGADPARPTFYAVTLPAADREARSALAVRGVAIDAVGAESVTTVVDAAGLAELRGRGLIPLTVTPLDFPPSDDAFHNYAEMTAAVAATAAAYPAITRVITAGLSLEGRAILGVKISDEPEVDDPSEPAVLFMALTHAREHLTVEMALAVIRMFTEGYGRDPALTNLVNTREIWVLPNANPDGGEYDIATGGYVYWRKNRRPNAGGSFGVDLNRNYGYRWGCCGGSSPTPSSDTYRGPAAFSEPETQVVRDFVLAHPDITSAISFHTYGELILYPYGYTYTDQPPDMDPADLRTFTTLAGRMAASNNYRPQQASDLYTTDGDTVDWLYGARRIIAFTFEMYPVSSSPGFYPPAEDIAQQTARNLPAVTLLTALADAPRKIAGGAGDVIPPAASLVITPAGELLVGQPVSVTVSASDNMTVTLAALRLDGATVAMSTTAPLAITWTPAGPGPTVWQAVAFDAGGNMGLSAPVTVTAVYTASAALALPDPPRLALDAPLTLTFSRPITGASLDLAFDPPLTYMIISSNGLTAQIEHDPFRPATAYTLTLLAGRGPQARLEPAAWTFWSEGMKYFLPHIAALK